MKYRLIFALALSTVLFSCKNNDALSKVDPNSKDVEIPTVHPKDEILRAEREAANPTVQVPADGKYPVLTFDKKEHDFGTIKEGEKVETTFHFVNTGEADLIITNAVGTCGCTVPEYPKDPIKPGERRKLTVTFDSNGKPGAQQKSVNITCNTEKGSDVLTIKTNVTPKAGTQTINNNGMNITTTPN